MNNNKQYTATILWGKDSIKEFEQGNNSNLSRFNNRITTIQFETEAELKAYFRGIEDMNGWLDYKVLDV